VTQLTEALSQLRPQLRLELLEAVFAVLFLREADLDRSDIDEPVETGHSPAYTTGANPTTVAPPIGATGALPIGATVAPPIGAIVSCAP